MLLKILLVGWFAVVPQATTTCGNSATTQTQAVPGPEGASAVLKVSSEDDHAKDTHLCMADYQLLISHGSAQLQNIDLLSSDWDWGRKISLQLAGFTHDGRKVLGMLSESGSPPVQQIFEYSSDDGNVSLFDLPKLAARDFPRRCLAYSELVGTTETGSVVLQLRSGKYCAHTSRWLLNSVKGPLRRAPRNALVQELYGAATAPAGH